MHPKRSKLNPTLRNIIITLFILLYAPMLNTQEPILQLDIGGEHKSTIRDVVFTLKNIPLGKQIVRGAR